MFQAEFLCGLPYSHLQKSAYSRVIGETVDSILTNCTGETRI